jgi:hypothetical protein
MRSSPNFWRVSRKGPAVRVKVRVPKVFPPRDSDIETIQQGMDDAMGDDGQDLVFHVHLGTKSMVFMVAVLTQVIYIYSGAILEAFGYVHSSVQNP